MAYSFTLRAADRESAKIAVSNRLDEVFAMAPECADRVQAQAMAYAFIDTLPFDNTKDILVSLDGAFSGAGAAAQVALVPKIPN